MQFVIRIQDTAGQTRSVQVGARSRKDAEALVKRTYPAAQIVR